MPLYHWEEHVARHWGLGSEVKRWVGKGEGGRGTKEEIVICPANVLEILLLCKLPHVQGKAFNEQSLSSLALFIVSNDEIAEKNIFFLLTCV